VSDTSSATRTARHSLAALATTARQVRGGWAGYVAALAAVAVVSLAIGGILGRAHIANISILYLLAVLAAAIAFGRGPAVLASVAAFLTFDWFFVQPLHTFTVADPEEWIALLFFLIVAMLTGQLAADQRRRAQVAVQREREAVVLYDVARLMSEPDLEHALRTVAERLREELNLSGVAIDLVRPTGGSLRIAAGDKEAMRLLEPDDPRPAHVLHQGQAPTPGQRGATGTWARVWRPHPAGRNGSSAALNERVHAVPVGAGDRRVGTIYLVRHAEVARFDAADDRLLSAVAGQMGLLVERERLRREATDAEVLRRTDQLRTALLNAVSHDLRTPLASIIASAGSLRQSDIVWTEQERAEFAQAIEDQAQRLNRIVGNLLDLSRIEGGMLRPEKGWYDVGALIEDVVGRLRALTSRHRVVVDVEEDLPPVPLDYVEIDQVLTNLIENATKYSPAGSEIVVRVRHTGAEVRVQVADHGPGVPPPAMAHLFDPFYRVDHGLPLVKGLGLGLAVARGLVEAHGGRIWVDSRPGGGAVFTFMLPLNQRDRPSVEASLA
jgi:two-component system, OmpR family, sensor histidine kinase KdpD